MTDSCDLPARLDEDPDSNDCGHPDALNPAPGGFLLCAECFADYILAEHAAAESAFGYTPGEDACPIAESILANEAFLPYREVQALLHQHGHCLHSRGTIYLSGGRSNFFGPQPN